MCQCTTYAILTVSLLHYHHITVLIHNSGHFGPPLPFWAPGSPRHCRGCRWLVTPLASCSVRRWRTLWLTQFQATGSNCSTQIGRSRRCSNCQGSGRNRRGVAFRCHRSDTFLLRPRQGTRSIAMSPSVCLCVCVFVCPRSYLRNYTSELHQFFCACYLWPWLGSRVVNVLDSGAEGPGFILRR